MQQNIANWVAEGKGLPEDWSHHYRVFSNPGTEEDALRAARMTSGSRLPTIPASLFSRSSAPGNRRARGLDVSPAGHPGVDLSVVRAPGDRSRLPSHPTQPVGRSKATTKKDWAEGLGAGMSMQTPIRRNGHSRRAARRVAPTTSSSTRLAWPDRRRRPASSPTTISIPDAVARCPRPIGPTTRAAPLARLRNFHLYGNQVAFVQTATGSFTGTTKSGSTSVTAVSSCTGLTVLGTPVYGNGIPVGDTTVSCNGTTLTFGHCPDD